MKSYKEKTRRVGGELDETPRTVDDGDEGYGERFKLQETAQTIISLCGGVVDIENRRNWRTALNQSDD